LPSCWSSAEVRVLEQPCPVGSGEQLYNAVRLRGGQVGGELVGADEASGDHVVGDEREHVRVDPVGRLDVEYRGLLVG
jgi:hypothetical protein